MILDYEMLKLLLKFSSTFDSEILYHAVLKGDPKIIRALVELNPDSLCINYKISLNTFLF